MSPERWRTWRRRLYAAGIAGNLSILALYVVARTVGIPFFGPEAGEVEAVGAIDVATKLVEVALVGCLRFLRRGASAPLRTTSPPREHDAPAQAGWTIHGT